MKTKIIIALGILITAAIIGSSFPSFAFAKADVELMSINQEVSVGQKFSVDISISPKDETVYTSKISISYPSDMIEAGSFSFTPKWLELSQPGYDLMDPSQGKIIKTAGFPAGIEVGNTKVFGTITFTAKSTGTANIKISSDTQVYNDSNSNVFSGNQNQVNINIVPATENTNSTDLGTTTSTTSTTTLTLNQGASVNTISSLTSLKSILIILLVLILGVIGYGFYKKNK